LLPLCSFERRSSIDSFDATAAARNLPLSLSAALRKSPFFVNTHHDRMGMYKA
jgi:hypothetical protein